jgi:phage-related protein
LLGDGIYELREGRLRVLYFLDDGRMIVATHGFAKSTQKTPPAEQVHALALRKRYFGAKRTGRLVIEAEIGDVE